MKPHSNLKYLASLLLASLLVLGGTHTGFSRELHMQSGIFTIPPWGMQDAEGNISGVTLDMLEAIGEQSDISFSHNYLPFKRMIELIKRGKVDISAFYRDDQIPSKTVLPIIFLHYDNVIAVGKKDRNLNNFEDLKGLSIAMPRGVHYLPRYDNEPTINKIFTSGHDNSVKLLLRNRVDAIAGSERAIEANLLKQGTSLSELGETYFIARHEVWVHVSTISVDKKTIKNIVKGVKKLKSTGQFERILSKYYK